jgi:hypothetical protein
MTDIVGASHVSRHWRTAALGASELWLSMLIRSYDLEHDHVLLELLRRSGERKISLELQFTQRGPDSTRLQEFLEAVVKPSLHRCRTLIVDAKKTTWDIILFAFDQEIYPSLRVLKLNCAIGSGVLFPLPDNHQVEEVTLYHVELDDVPLPCMRSLRVIGRLVSMVETNGKELNRWFLDGPETLEFSDLTIPPMGFAQEEITPTLTVLRLTLARIRPTTTTAGVEYDCAPFFDCLQTPLLRSLALDSLRGRTWEDFLFSLDTPQAKYPLVTTLSMKFFDFQDLAYAGVAFFLRAFPALTSIILVKCKMPTWESIIHVLMLDPTLCLDLRGVEVDGVFLDREEPLPLAFAPLLYVPPPRRRYLPTLCNLSEY